MNPLLPKSVVGYSDLGAKVCEGTSGWGCPNAQRVTGPPQERKHTELGVSAVYLVQTWAHNMAQNEGKYKIGGAWWQR